LKPPRKRPVGASAGCASTPARAPRKKYSENLPDETVEAIREHRVAIKGPLTTPVGSGFRSLNVALRQTLDLYANVRPTYYLDGVPSPMKAPEEMDMVTFRENTEDVYAGIEWEAGTDDSEKVRDFVEEEMDFDGIMHEGDIGLGLKPISERGASASSARPSTTPSRTTATRSRSSTRGTS